MIFLAVFWVSGGDEVLDNVDGYRFAEIYALNMPCFFVVRSGSRRVAVLRHWLEEGGMVRITSKFLIPRIDSSINHAAKI